MNSLIIVEVMNHKESDIIKEYGWDKHQLREVRSLISDFEGIKLWFREESKKPKHLQTIWWTDTGVFYLKEYFKTIKEIEKPTTVDENRAMTKAEFDKVVNNTKWIGKVFRNTYKNPHAVLVDHETGFRVIVNCRDNKMYPKFSYVEVDTRNNKHTIRKPAFKTYEKAKQA